jgi:hypothetical protein
MKMHLYIPAAALITFGLTSSALAFTYVSDTGSCGLHRVYTKPVLTTHVVYTQPMVAQRVVYTRPVLEQRVVYERPALGTTRVVYERPAMVQPTFYGERRVGFWGGMRSSNWGSFNSNLVVMHKTNSGALLPVSWGHVASRDFNGDGIVGTRMEAPRLRVLDLNNGRVYKPNHVNLLDRTAFFKNGVVAPVSARSCGLTGETAL